MGVNINSLTPQKPAQEENPLPDPQPAPNPTPQASPQPAGNVATSIPVSENPSPLMTGPAAQAALKSSSQGKQTYRFYIKGPGETRKVLFLNGDLRDDGLPDVMFAWEHAVPGPGNNWKQVKHYFCTQHTDAYKGEPCPICLTENNAYLAAYLSVLDFTPYTKQDGTVIPCQKRLMVAKPMAFSLLQMQIEKRGGITGAVYDVARTSKKASAIGDVFDFCEKGDLEETRKSMVESGMITEEQSHDLFTPVDVLQEMPFHSPAELQKLGFTSTVIGSGAPITGHSPIDPSALAKNM